MKKTNRASCLLECVWMLAVLAAPAYGSLIDNGNGLIYDTVTNSTWLQNADLAATNTFGVSGVQSDGSMDGPTANAWIAAMNAADYLGFSDWRLPLSAGGCVQIGPCVPFSFYGNELAELWSTELGNTYPVTLIDGNTQSVINTGLFTSVQNGPCCSGNVEGPYWTFVDGQPIGTAVPSVIGAGGGAIYYMGGGNGTTVVADPGGDKFYAWAVLPGDAAAAAPEPATFPLLGSGFVGLGWFAWRRKRVSAGSAKG